MRNLSIIFLAILVIGCRNPRAAGDPSVAMPADAVVLAGSKVSRMLHQCSRRTPALGESTWAPGADDIVALERRLPQALRAHADKGGPDLSKAPTGWQRQYVGLVRQGHRLIYGNFFRDEDSQTWRTEPFIICDGGPVFFGVEYDVGSRAFTDIAFNGYP